MLKQEYIAIAEVIRREVQTQREEIRASEENHNHARIACIRRIAEGLVGVVIPNFCGDEFLTACNL